MTQPISPDEGDALKVRKFPDLLNVAEQRSILTESEQLWEDLRRNELGGFSGINRPFYILAAFKSVIEKYGNRDVGLTWSKDDLDATRTDSPVAMDEVEALVERLECFEMSDALGNGDFSLIRETAALLTRIKDSSK